MDFRGKKRILVLGLIIGENKIVSLVSSYLPGNPVKLFPPRQVITFWSVFWDLKSGKSQTGRSLIDRGAKYEGRTVGERHHGRRW